MEQQLLTVLIVDDEIPLRQQLKCYDWESMGAIIIGEAEDGEEALQFCKEHKPDIVFTDISMPIMNGMELLQKLRTEQIYVQVVLLTCHSEFDFAQVGIQLGAIDYLIKISFTEQDLRRALVKARHVMDRERIYTLTAAERRQWEHTLQIHKLLESDPISSELYEVLTDNGLFSSNPSPMVGIHLDCYAKDRQFLAREIQAALSREVSAFLWFPLEKGYLLLHHAKLTQPQIIERLHMITASISRELERTFSFIAREYRLIGWISQPYETVESYSRGLQKLVRESYRFFYVQETVHLLYPSLSPDQAKQNDLSLIDELENKLQSLGTNRMEIIGYIQNEFARWCMEKQPPSEALKSFIAQWLQRVTRSTMPDSKLRSQNPILNAFTLEHLVGSILHQLTSEAQPEAKLRPEVRLTIELIQSRISEPITLNSIAEEVGLRSHYLGKLFREGVGESFNEYISKLRIRKATQLLSTTNMKVYEVADQVGIKSYRYFTILFRQYTGQTPSEFKRE